MCIDVRLLFRFGFGFIAGWRLVCFAQSKASSVVNWSPGCVALVSEGLGKVMSGGELVMIVARMIGLSELSRDDWFKVYHENVLGEGWYRYMIALRMIATPQLYVSCCMIVCCETMGDGRRGAAGRLLWSNSVRRVSMEVRSKRVV